jgi:hypothetical protein
MKAERLQLVGLDRARYFMPTAICLYLGVLCSVLILTSPFLVHLQNAVAVAVAGGFGLVLSGALGGIFWRAQRRDLQYTRVATSNAAAVNYAAVRAAVGAAGWTLVRDEPARRLEARAAVLLLNEGERVTVEFRDSDVLVVSICDPSVGFSLAGRRHCAEHRALVLRAVGAVALPGGAPNATVLR